MKGGNRIPRCYLYYIAWPETGGGLNPQAVKKWMAAITALSMPGYIAHTGAFDCPDDDCR